MQSRFLLSLLLVKFLVCLQKKFGPGETRGFCCFVEFFEGCLGKCGGWTWFFDGENVVECVVNVVRKTKFLRGGKIRHVFQLYFCRGAGEDVSVLPW